MDSEVFIESKCNKILKPNELGIYCHDCSLQEITVICSECFDKSKHFGHEIETVISDIGIGCDCGNEANIKSDGFCTKHNHCSQLKLNRNRSRSFKGSGNKSRKPSEYTLFVRRESEGFFDGILHHLFSGKPLDLPEFYDLNKVSKYSLDGIVISKYFIRSRAHYLEDELKIKRIYEINKLNNKYPNIEFLNKKRKLLWYSIDNRKGNECLAKILNNGIGYENGSMGRAIYFKDRIKRLLKYDDKEFGLLLLCEVGVGNMYRVLNKSTYKREVPFGYDSIKCVGKYTPNPNKSTTIGNDIVVPTGKTIINEDIETDFDINQYIVFDKTQLIIRYLVQYYEHK